MGGWPFRATGQMSSARDSSWEVDAERTHSNLPPAYLSLPSGLPLPTQDAWEWPGEALARAPAGWAESQTCPPHSRRDCSPPAPLQPYQWVTCSSTPRAGRDGTGTGPTARCRMGGQQVLHVQTHTPGLGRDLLSGERVQGRPCPRHPARRGTIRRLTTASTGTWKGVQGLRTGLCECAQVNACVCVQGEACMGTGGWPVWEQACPGTLLSAWAGAGLSIRSSITQALPT